MIATAHLITFSLLFLLSVFSYSHLNWKDDLFLLTLIGLYLIGLLSRRLTQELRNYFLIFILIFLLSQFYINNFQPGKIRWWFASIPGWLTLILVLTGLLSLMLYEKNRRSHPPIQKPDQTFEELITKVSSGIILVSLAMFFIFLFNLEECSAQTKLVPEYSAYMIVGFGLTLFYSLNHSFGYLHWGKMRLFFNPLVLGIPILLVGLGTVKIYRVYTVYWNALDSKKMLLISSQGTEEMMWLDVLKLNRTPKISSIEVKALSELGNINIKAAKYRQASNYFNQVLARNAFHFEANLGLAEIAYRQNNWKEAREGFQRSIYLKPQESRLYSYYVHSCIRDGRIEKAVEFIDGKYRPRPLTLEAEDYLIIGEFFLKKKRLQQAIFYLQKARESMANHAEVYLLLGKAYLESGQYRSGCEILERAIQLNLKTAEAFHHLGIGYENIHQDHKAIEAFERAVLIDNKNIEGFYHLKRLYRRIGLENKAIKTENIIETIATNVIEAADWKGRSGENVYQNGEMYWTGTVSADVLLKGGSAKFIIQAMGSSAKGVWPHMVVRLDNEIISEVDVTSEKLQKYEFKKLVKPGKYNLCISFTNDEATLDKTGKVIEDRNLFVKKCRITYD